MKSNLIYTQDYFGFIYIWFDRKHYRYYIGSHMGSVDDGYICSSSWMKQAYKKRPQDFKRRIINYSSVNDRKILLLEEERWLTMIKDEELCKRYYNRCKRAYGVSQEEIGKYSKSHWSDPEKKQKHREGMSKAWTPERKAAHAEKLRKRWEEGNYKERDNTMTSEGRKRQIEAVRISTKNRVYSKEMRENMRRAAIARCTPEWSERQGKLMRDAKI